MASLDTKVKGTGQGMISWKISCPKSSPTNQRESTGANATTARAGTSAQYHHPKALVRRAVAVGSDRSSGVGCCTVDGAWLRVEALTAGRIAWSESCVNG